MPTKLHEQVKELHRLIGQPIEEKPLVPDEKWVRLRGRLIIEEAFEFLESLTGSGDRMTLLAMKEKVKDFVSEMTIDVDLPGVADALGDIAYVVEGSNIAFGIDGGPIADEIHRANMTKAGPLDKHGKGQKPPGWKPPDITGELKKQGWKE